MHGWDRALLPNRNLLYALRVVAARVTPLTAMKKLRIVILRFGTARQKMVLE